MLTAPRGDATRPTSDRVREALFGILSSERDLRGACVLDLYAGTGALAFEALSRGAACATLVESSRAAVQAILANTRSLGSTARVRVVPTTVERAGSALSRGSPFDLIFADPPYAQVTNGHAPAAIVALVEARVLAPGARLILEHGKADASPIMAGLALDDTRRYGDTALSFYRIEGSPSERPQR